jgi:hypothetical protein
MVQYAICCKNAGVSCAWAMSNFKPPKVAYIPSSRGGGDSSESYRMPLPLYLNPQNYSRGQDKTVFSFCTCLVHPASGGGGVVLSRVLDFVPGCVWLVHVT